MYPLVYRQNASSYNNPKKLNIKTRFSRAQKSTVRMRQNASEYVRMRQKFDGSPMYLPFGFDGTAMYPSN